MAHSKSAELFVLSGREAPELQELNNLPDGIHLLETGRPDVDLKGAQHACPACQVTATKL